MGLGQHLGGESSVATLAPREQFCFPVFLWRPTSLLSCYFWVIVALAVPVRIRGCVSPYEITESYST